ncbi:MAG: DUF2723 domain-containing protein [Bacteroidaceae bacterium]|nr:DUF2723 domain-containing protein [Bacteroidaceae bacterium]MBQ1200288.1 DUF2723 domain-containing protein [Bacteroidaceae bacterium]
MKQFKLIDTLMGWIAFAIAAFVYCSTIEPTASFWDCPEFITTAFKLEVGHPPGAPFFMLTGNLFSQFTDDPAKVAMMVNIMSALLSAACIMFLFWSISHLTRKLVGENGQIKTWGQGLTVELAAMTGAMAYTFSDTFWYSAVEGEVYAYSSLFTAVVFWLILKWEDNADKPGADRWLILIAYLTGLSIGVHLLNLLCLPALVLVWYYKRNTNPNVKGSLMALLGSFVLVAVVLYGIVPGIVKVGGWFELLFVNKLDQPFNTGLIMYLLVLIATVLWAIWESTKQKSRLRMNLSFIASIGMLGIPFYGHGISSVVIGVVAMVVLYFVLNYAKDGIHWVSARLMNTTLLCLLMIMIGYSSYAVIVIRSEANPPMDQNSPEDVFTLGSYLARDQYGDSPLLYGQPYSSPVKMEVKGQYYVPAYTEGAPQYQRVEKKTEDEPDRYEIIDYKKKYIYAYNMLFPRMHSDRHKNNYEEWMGGIEGKNVTIDHLGERKTIKVPTMWENLYFFYSYQVNFMYWRYFMWNFAGRQNDIQGHGEYEHGNWITGIPFLDNMRLGDQSKLPTELRENKGRNVFYCLPLLLGIIGLIWQVNKRASTKEGMVDEGVKQFWVVFFLFFMTGLAIVLYLNQTPVQPRERDYAYAGSFYAFAIWIGLGVAAISDLLNKFVFKKHDTMGAVMSGLCLLVPVQMASQTWDDHDRSGRYTCRDFGQNYLMSLDEGKAPIIFTNGDNDTFPLWYCQETEGFRTDARVCNLSYLQTDWYIDQMKRPAHDSPAVPITWKRLQYVTGTREGISVRPGELERAIEILKDDPQAMKELLGENPYELSNIIDKWILNDDEVLQCFPTDSVVITIDKEAVRRSGMMIAGDSIPDVMHISLKGKRAVYKNEMMIYEMLCRTNWERPMYVACTVGSDNYGSLGNNFVREGLADRITPFNTKESGMTMDTERMYDNLMNKFRFGGLDNPEIYLDETVLRMCYTHRRLFATLAMQLMREGKEEKALEVVRYAKEVIPAETVRHNYMSGSMDLARVWLMHGEKQEAEGIVTDIATNACEYLDWYATLKPRVQQSCAQDILYNVYQLSNAVEILESAESANLKEMEEKLQAYHVMFSGYLYR